jgi:hypothetical protein
MITHTAFLNAARSELGYTESPSGSNRTKFAAEAGHANGQPWCATFLVAIARRVGLRLPSESAYTPAMANGFRSAGRWHSSPAPGDLAFFDFPGDSKARIQHVGIVESSTATTVTSIEGNTAPGTAGSQDNGGGVWRRTRPRSHVVGYGRPDFTVQEDDMAITDIEKAEIIDRLRSMSTELGKLAVEIRDPSVGIGVDVDRIRATLDQLGAKLDSLSAGGGVDVDVLATRVADLLAQRLAA